ncbi:hypothetical protein ACTXI4_07255 [Glutamicibacter ardleyensis]
MSENTQQPKPLTGKFSESQKPALNKMTVQPMVQRPKAPKKK